MTLTAAIFPGQGSQVVGMGKDVAAASPAAAAVFDQANDALGFDIKTLCFEGPASELEKTDNQQPTIFVASVAIWAAMMEAGVPRDAFARMGGLSLGEYTALYAAGAVDFDQALKLVRHRGQLMQEASTVAPSGMVSLLGADEEKATALCDKARGDDVLAPANFNCPGQIVISGSKRACDRAMELVEAFGVRGIALPVAGAFHSPLMASAADGLFPTLEATNFREPEVPVAANVDGGYHTTAPAMRDSLCRQITQPVMWQRCIERMMEDGVERFVEIGPGRVLTGLMRKINRKKEAVNVSTAETLSAAVEVLK